MYCTLLYYYAMRYFSLYREYFSVVKRMVTLLFSTLCFRINIRTHVGITNEKKTTKT